MSNKFPDLTDLARITISRRTLLGSAAVAGVALATGLGTTVLGTSNAFAAQASAAASAADFLKLSTFLTNGKSLDVTLASRYLAALNKHDPKFGDALAALQSTIAESKAANIDELLERPDLADPARQTIKTIVSAWYLGVVGEDDKAELIAYAEALMYRPTADVLVVPTYGGGPDSWGAKPPVSTKPNSEKKS